ncbi:MAG: ABC transporter substrate-binding protein [Planctomycetota bacterium]
MRPDLVNAGLLGAALALAPAGTLAWSVGGASSSAPGSGATEPGDSARPTELTDARGVVVPVAPYARVLSLSTVADHLLLELLEPDRLVGITQYVRDSHPERWRFGDRPGIRSSSELERVLLLEPDLVVVTPFADEAYMARVRESGARVFDLGETRGVESTLRMIRTLGGLLDAVDRANALEGRLVRQLWALDAAVPPAERVPGLYLGVYGDSFTGGTTGTSYADLLVYGGVRDVAAEAGFDGWPRYDPEDLLALDPSVIVTTRGGGIALRNHSLLGRLRACGPEGRIVELPDGYAVDPGFGLVEAAQAVQTALHPERTPSAAGR